MFGVKGIDEGIDGNAEIDWGKTSEDYARHRPPPPDSFFKKLQALDIGLAGQDILDIGTGTGIVARQMARQGAVVTACDISDIQVKMAKYLAESENLAIDFHCFASEDMDFPAHSFDIVTANQCFVYFDREKTIPILRKILRPHGLLVISHFSWLPLHDETAYASEQLILKHNPQWSAHSYDGMTAPAYPGVDKDFHYQGYFYYDEAIPFTHEGWRGRIRASRGIGASLSDEQVAAFDAEHDALLRDMAGDEFTILHRIDAHILRLGKANIEA